MNRARLLWLIVSKIEHTLILVTAIEKQYITSPIKLYSNIALLLPLEVTRKAHSDWLGQSGHGITTFMAWLTLPL